MQALPPRGYQLNEALLLFPKDGDAGGTWICLSDNLNVAVLLNGAFANHQSSAPYARSRGLVLIDILAEPTPTTGFSRINLKGIEPFTLILLQQFALYECRWNGDKKYMKQLSIEQDHIWSSVTLYDETVQRKRENWFAKWHSGIIYPSKKDIFHFHQFAGDGDEQNDIQMNRNGQLFTTSITCIELAGQTGIMNYLDLKDGMYHSKKINSFTGTLSVN